MVSMRQQLAMLDCRIDAEMAKLARGQPGRARVSRQEAREAAQQRRAVLTQIVEQDVIPALSQRYRGILAASSAGPAIAVAIGPAHVAALANLVLAQDEEAPLAYVDALHRQGVLPESVYLDLLAPAALRLGELWEQDLCDCIQVTIGLWRLQAAMRELSPAFLGDAQTYLTGPRIMLAPLPGEQHDFGLSMVFEFFLRAGWDAWCGTVASSRELAARVSSEWIDVVGLSIARGGQLDAARAEIGAIRRASRNPAIAVLVGGAAVAGHPSIAALVGADAAASDAREAVVQAQGLAARAGEGRRQARGMN